MKGEFWPLFHEFVAIVVLGLLMCLVVRTFRSVDRDPTNTLSLLDLITENGRMSRGACATWLVLGVASWCVVYMTLTEKLSDVIFSAYVASIVVPAIKAFFDPPTRRGSPDSLTADTVPLARP